MSSMTTCRLIGFWLVTTTIAAQGQGKLEGQGAARRFVSEQYRFSIAVPPGWNASLSRSGTPVFLNYPPSRGLPQLRLPKGGARISVVVNETLYGRHQGNTLSDWAINDMRIEADATPMSPEPFEMRGESNAKDAIILSYDSAIFEVGEQKQHIVAIYWEFRQKPLAAYLYYAAGDPKAANVEKVFLDTVRSIRPL